MNILQGVKDQEHKLGIWLYQNVQREAKETFANACSARLFSGFEITKPLSNFSVFSHENCRSERKVKEMWFSVKPVADQTLRDMRHKTLCHELDGRVASCVRCEKFFRINDVIQNALNSHLGKKNEIEFQFPEKRCKPLDRIVYEMGKDFSWMDQSDYQQSIRYFVGNAATNVHFTTHAQRCSKRAPNVTPIFPMVSRNPTNWFTLKNLISGAPGVVWNKKDGWSASSPNVSLKMLSWMCTTLWLRNYSCATTTSKLG